jgi:hypothetical protein
MMKKSAGCSGALERRQNFGLSPTFANRYATLAKPCNLLDFSFLTFKARLLINDLSCRMSMVIQGSEK